MSAGTSGSPIPARFYTLAVVAAVALSFVGYNYLPSDSQSNLEKFKASIRDKLPEEMTDEELENLDPFQFLPPEEEIKAAEMEQRKLMEFIANEKKALKEMTRMIRDDLKVKNGGKCKAPSNAFISEQCAHIEEKAWREIAGVNLYFITTECSDSLKNGKPWVIFLHGAKYSSHNWIDVNLLRMTAKMGFNNIAIDLPGYGKTGSGGNPVADSDFIEAVVAHFQLDKYIVVSPSMSGKYSIPLLKKNKPELKGFVAVAPGKTELIDDNAQAIKTPTLIIVGENDKQLGTTSIEHLSKLKNNRVVKVPQAGHPCYLDQPKVFTRDFFEYLLCDVKW